MGATTTKKGLRIQAQLDSAAYEKGVKVSDKELALLRVDRSTFHGEWNYTIMPAQT